ncbi:MAG: DUF4931 domain-containing protein [Campylobacterota bacterium]|nr:DUF4931 domain-containing protein [Campylobacterota bacterium]
MSEIRYDVLNDTHVIIAPERLHRPDQCGIDQETYASENCPFCEGNESMTPPEIFSLRGKKSFANEPGWQTRVVPNLYRAVQIEVQHQFYREGLFHKSEGFGAHEVIIDTPNHHSTMTQWSEEEIANWIKTMRARVSDLRHDHRITFISLFKNQGTQAGSTQPHPHTQLIGLSIIPKADRECYERTHTHYKTTGKALLESLLLQEEEEVKRIVAKAGDFTAFCPYASGYPFEVMISSKKAVGQIDTLSDEAILSLSSLLLDVLKKMERQLMCFDFNLQITTPPLQHGPLGSELLHDVEYACRFAIRIMPRLYRHGGFEVSTGMMINPVAPEMAAKLLRESDDVR